MEIRELAERVLFSPALVDKLAAPEALTDNHPGAAIHLPAGPARRPGLGLHEIRGRSPFPRHIDRDADRGAVLHAFANHELLALELMALVLLRFPDAPPAFRRGLAHILGEEAIHFQLYAERMKEVGLEFGALPINRFLWDSVVGVASIEDYTARMSLTFEAANLDHALLWAGRFRSAGDPATAAVLDRVYADELNHVRHGLHWFRKKLPDGADLWSAYAAALPPPLTPARAKGEIISPEARRAAGFDEAFVEAVSLYQHSKGRPPVVHLFNPDAEAQVAHPGQPPTGPGAALAEDLDLLPLWIAAPDDVVVARKPPDPVFLKGLLAAGVALPQIEVCADLDRLGQSTLAQRKLGGLDPWGWSPQSSAWLAPLRPALVSPAPEWNPAWRPLYNKAWAAARLAELLVALPEERGLCDVETAGRAVRDLGDLTSAQEEFATRGFRELVVKPPFGTAGRGTMRLSGPPDKKQAEALLRLWAAEGETVVEPWLDRVTDLSFHLDILPDGAVRYRGAHRFFTTPAGRYLGSWLGGFFSDLPADQARFLAADGRERRWLDRVGRATAAHVGKSAAALGYVGPLGVDALVYRSPDGLRLRPIVEVNPRLTMGRLAMALSRRLAPGRAGVWAVLSAGDVRKSGSPDLTAWAASRPPPLWDAEGRLTGGVLPTTDPRAARMFTSALSAGPDAGTCWRALGSPGAQG